MELRRIEAKFRGRLNIVDREFSRIAVEYKRNKRFRNIILLDGLISATLQSWDIFCRQLIMASYIGCETKNGVITSPIEPNLDEQRLSYLAKCAISNVSNPRPNRRIFSLRDEPSWGYPSNCLNIFARIYPRCANVSSLNQAFQLQVQAPEHLRITRNGCAHINVETLNEVRNLLQFYSGSPIIHPTEIVLHKASSGNYALNEWTNDLRTIANIATR